VVPEKAHERFLRRLNAVLVAVDSEQDQHQRPILRLPGWTQQRANKQVCILLLSNMADSAASAADKSVQVKLVLLGQ